MKIKNINTRLAAGALALTMGLTLGGHAKATTTNTPTTPSANLEITSTWGIIDYKLVPYDTDYYTQYVPMQVSLKITHELENTAWEVIAGNYGNGQQRKNKLKEAGYNAEIIQKIVDYIWSQFNSKEIIKPVNSIFEENDLFFTTVAVPSKVAVPKTKWVPVYGEINSEQEKTLVLEQSKSR